MQYTWHISHGNDSHRIALRDDFVAAEFYELADRIGTDKELPQDKNELRRFKLMLSENIWQKPISDHYLIDDKPIQGM